MSLLTLFLACKSNSIAREEKANADMAKLVALKDQVAYSVEIEAVYPFSSAATQQVVNAFFLSRTGDNASRVDVGGDGHYITVKTDSVSGNLSFFGERRLSGGAYGGQNGGIVFDGVPKDYKKTINEKKGKIEIEFRTSQTNEPQENYDVVLQIFPNESVVVDITSTYKTFIRYSGRLQPIKEAQ